TASESGFDWPVPAGMAGSGGATFTTSVLALSPAAAAAPNRASACSRSLAFQTGALTRKTKFLSSTLANLHWSAKVAGRLWRSTGSSLPSQRARSTTLPSPVPESASSASGGRRAGGAEPRSKGLDRSVLMNILIAANCLRGPKKLAFDQPKVLASALGIVGLVLGLAFSAGFLARGADGAARAEIAKLQAEFEQQAAELAV